MNIEDYDEQLKKDVRGKKCLMHKMKNIFIEGIQGTGKTPLLRLLGQALLDYHVYWEGDYYPVELAWCTYMTEQQYRESLDLFPDLTEEIQKNTYQEGTFYIVTYTRILAERRDFYEYMEQYIKAVMFGKYKKYLEYQKCPLL